MKDIPFHALANVFPLLDGADFDEFCQDIADQGLLEPIILLDGKILDGRNRFRACQKNGVEPRFERFDGPDPVAFVVSKNLRRRHSNESQRAMSAARLANLSDGHRLNTGQDLSPTQICASETTGVTQSEAAELLNVSVRLVQQAKKVQAEAEPEIADAVDAGDLSVSAAAQAADLPAKAQKAVAQAAAEDGKAAAARTLKDQQESLVNRKGCQGLKDALAAGRLTLAAAARIAALSVPQQLAHLKDHAAPAETNGTNGHHASGTNGKVPKAPPGAGADWMPGDGTPEAPPKPPKNGAVLFDQKTFTAAWEALYRQIDKAGKSFGVKDGPQAEKFRRRMVEWKTDLLAWVKELTKAQAARA